MKINIQFPKDLNSDNINSMKDVETYYASSMKFLEPIAEKAFADRDESSWSQIQHILYHYNTRDFERTIDPLSFQAVAERAVRNGIVAIQNKHHKTYAIDLEGGYTADKAIDVLMSTALKHRINNHPLFDIMKKGLSKDEIRIFLDNYYVNNRLFHLHLTALTQASPLERRNDLAVNFYDEMGGEEANDAHPLLFMKNYEFIGASSSINPTPGTLHLLNTKVQLCHLSSDFRLGFGGLGFIEISMPTQMKLILDGLTKSGMNASQSIFWDLHITIDEQHGESWFEEMREMITSEEDYKIILDSGVRLLNARADLYDDIYSEIASLRMAQEQEKEVSMA